MFDLGWSEIFLVMIVAVLVFGPQEIPVVMHSLGRVFRRLQYVRFALSKQFDDLMKAHDLDELRKGVNFEAKNFKPDEFDEAGADESETLSLQGEGGEQPKDANRVRGVQKAGIRNQNPENLKF